MRKILSPLFSLFTLVGGHFLNRRLDLGLLFFGLLVLSGLIIVFSGSLVSWVSGMEGGSLDFSQYRNFVLGWMAGLFALLVASVLVSYKSADTASARPPLGGTGLVAGIVTVLISTPLFLGAGYMGAQYLPMIQFDPEDVSESSSRISSEYSYNDTSYVSLSNVRYGGDWVHPQSLDSMPEGSAYITGRIMFGQEPAVGVRIHLFFDERYRSRQIVTDEQGLFALPVPEGEWMLNRIEFSGWNERPRHANKLVITGGPTPSLEEGMYHDGPRFGAEGLRLQSTPERMVLPGLDLTIRPSLQVRWPDAQGAQADPKSSRLSWDEQEGASRYQVQLHRIERQGTTTSYYPIAWHNTTFPEAPLSAFSTVPDEADSENEYMVAVYAFDGEKDLIGRTQDFDLGKSLILRGAQVVNTREEPVFDYLAALPAEEALEQMRERSEDKRLLEAAQTLVKEGLLDAAQTLVDRVDAPSLKQERLRASGMILAARGQCDEARVLLDEANVLRGSECYPEIFTERCGGE